MNAEAWLGRSADLSPSNNNVMQSRRRGRAMR